MAVPGKVFVYWYLSVTITLQLHSLGCRLAGLPAGVRACIHSPSCMHAEAQRCALQEHVQLISANRILDVAVEQEAAEIRTFSCRTCLHAPSSLPLPLAARWRAHLPAPQPFCATLSSRENPNARGH